MNNLVEGVNWFAPSVLQSKNMKSFVSLHMKDSGTYPDFDSDRKRKALELVWGLSGGSEEKPVLEEVK
jgi:hypothetical protein